MTTTNEAKLTQATCVAVSNNTNSFGLHQMLFLTAGGSGFAAYASSLNLIERGTRVRFSDWGTYAVRRSWECPESLASVTPERARRILNEVAKLRRARTLAAVS